MRKVSGACLLLVVLLSGCRHIYDGIDEKRTAFRQQWQAGSAWDACKDSYRKVPHRDHFEDGFEAGFIDVASGGDGCPPVVPPERYWRDKYRGPAGQRKMVAWFDGYSHGAVAAERRGVARANSIVLAPAYRHGPSVPPYHAPPQRPLPSKPPRPTKRSNQPAETTPPPPPQPMPKLRFQPEKEAPVEEAPAEEEKKVEASKASFKFQELRLDP